MPIPDSRLLKGLRPGVNQLSFAKAIADGTVESVVRSITVKPGDYFYLPSGTVHALGAGILAAEVQTPSDTTFRVFDFNRIDPSTGKRRSLHVEQAMQCVDFSGEAAKSPSGPDLVKCDYFSIRKVAAIKGQTASLPAGEPIVLMFIEGEARLTSAVQQISTDAARGDTVLIPASLKGTIASVQSDSLWLEVRLENPLK